MSTFNNDYQKLKADFLTDLEPLETLTQLSAYKLQPQNLEKSAIIEFAIQIAAAECRGSRKPTIEVTNCLLKQAGDFFKAYSLEKQPDLNSFFSNQTLYSDHIDGNADQAIESTWRRFEKYDKFLEAKIGFNVANAIYFTRILQKEITRRMKGIRKPKKMSIIKNDFYDISFFVEPDKGLIAKWSEVIRFTDQQLINLFSQDLHPKVKKYINLFSESIEKFSKPIDPLQKDQFAETPFIKIGDYYLIPTPYYLLHCLSLKIHNIMIREALLKGKYGHDKGKLLEERASEELRMLFQSAKHFRNVVYESNGAEPDADLIINIGEYLIFVECTTKSIPRESRLGNPQSVEDTLKHSIKKCYLQALRAKQAYLDGRIKLSLENKPSKFVLMVVTDELYPNLLSEHVISKRNGSKSYLDILIQNSDYPYIISIKDLQSIRPITTEQHFMTFIQERLSMYEQPCFLAYDEYDYFLLYNKKEYAEIKEKALMVQTIISYVAHQPSPFIKPNTFHAMLEAIGSERFSIIKIGKNYDERLAEIALSLLYDLYGDWHLVIKHTVFDINSFITILEGYTKQGKKCRAIVWEGFFEYLDFCKEMNNQPFYKYLERKVLNGEISDQLSLLITFPTNIYADREFRLKVEDHKKTVK